MSAEPNPLNEGSAIIAENIIGFWPIGWDSRLQTWRSNKTLMFFNELKGIICETFKEKELI